MRRPVIAAAAVLALLVAVQLVAPVCAERRVRGQIEDAGGEVERVEVSAFPAFELLFGSADDVTIELSSYTSARGRLADQLARTKNAGSLDATTRTLRAGGLTLRDAGLRKRGRRLTGTATVTDADLRAALPAGLAVRPVAAVDGELVFEGEATLLGITARVRLRALAQDGGLVVRPEGIPFGALATITVFRDPRISVTSLDARAVEGGFRVSAQALLAD